MADGGIRGYLVLIVPILSFLLEVAGIGAIVWGFTLIAPFLGFIAGGIGLLVLGMAVDPPSRSKTKRSDSDQDVQ